MLEALKLKIALKDDEFDTIYPLQIRNLSAQHFTPFGVAKVISDWLNEYKEPLNVLDLGCGVGKFCFIAHSFTHHTISGVDYREKYINLCNKIKLKYRFKNLLFLNRNITEIDLKDYNAFYFFNSFLEQIDDSARIDDEYERSGLIYNIYESHLRNELSKMPIGTLIITYHAFFDQIPGEFEVIKHCFDGKLLMWEKK